ncbi:MAG TPA: DUF4238 domain-containing protein [Candidatus Dojkabacteria bacterium]|nr:DUF4238 domain-containing protein [Candidatus Dojkabacteria bacterium]
MSELHIKNHFVPECYLKFWENENSEIHVYRLLVTHNNVPEWQTKPRSAIAYQQHLYTQIIAGNESDDFEKWLDKEYETPATKVLEKAILEKRLTTEDWIILISFLAAQDVRTPSRLYEHLDRGCDSMASSLESTLCKLKERLESNSFEEPNNREIKDNDLTSIPLKVTIKPSEDGKGKIVKAETYVGRSSWIFSMKYLLKNTCKKLHEHKWTIVKPAKGYKWLTSDNPVIKLNFINYQNYNLQGGWGKTKGNIIFPISPEHAMFTQIGERPIQKGTRLSLEHTKFFRKIMCENASRFIFSSYQDNEVMKLMPRKIDKEQYLFEQNELDKWHERNKSHEIEY